MSHALAQLQQAAALATRYQLSTWFLSMHFMEAVLTTPVSLQDADGGLMVGHGQWPAYPHTCYEDTFTAHVCMADNESQLASGPSLVFHNQ